MDGHLRQGHPGRRDLLVTVESTMRQAVTWFGQHSRKACRSVGLPETLAG